MANNINLQFYMVADDKCTYLNVYENAQWKTDNLPIERDDVALALFWTTDNTSGCDLTNPGDSSSKAEWQIEMSEQGIYNVYMFAVLVWEDGMTIEEGQIVYYNGVFYRYSCDESSSSSSCVVTTPGTSEEWTEMTCNDLELFLAWAGDDGNATSDPFNGAYFSSIYNFDCISKRIYRIGCNKYRVLAEGLTNERPILIKVYTLANELLDCYYIDTLKGETYKDIEFDEDNVYIIEVGSANIEWTGTGSAPISGGEGEVVDGEWVLVEDCEYDGNYTSYQEVVYSICDIETCWTTLTKNILCRPVDVCCDTCDTDTLKMIDDYRYTLNMMNSLWFNLMAYIEIDKGLYQGLYSVYEINGDYTDPDRMNYLLQIQDIITMLKEIVLRCGDCSATDSTSNNCQTC